MEKTATKPILMLITSHPKAESLTITSANILEETAKKQGYDVRKYNVYDFPLVRFGDPFNAEFNPPADTLSQAAHIVFVCPMWNVNMPGPMKNFLDGLLQPRKHFRYTKSLLPIPEGFLPKLKVHAFWSSGGPFWFYRILPLNLLIWNLRFAFLNCGVRLWNIRQRSLHNTFNMPDEKFTAWKTMLENYRF